MRFFCISIVFLLLPAAMKGQQRDPFLSYELTYTGEVAGNIKGGLKQGTVYLGMATAGASFLTEKAGLWKGGELHLMVANNHGGTPSETLIGDFQVASNIEAGNHTYLFELWYKQTLGKVSFTFGLQDLNALFAVSENGTSFLNSSFGVPSVLSDNIPVPIFPLTSLGLTAEWIVSDRFTWQAAVYDGCPEVFEDNPYNIHWDINKNDGVLLFNEFHLNSADSELPGAYKVGAYYHSGLNEENTDNNTLTSVFSHNYGVYFLADQVILKRNERSKLSAFTQISLSPETINSQNLYTGAGLTYSGLFRKKGDDLMGLAVASAFFNRHTVKHETAIELTYNMPLAKYFFIQPDIQYIIHPAANDEITSNAFALFIRFGLTLASN